MEFPEDLGTTKNGWPASCWSMKKLREMPGMMRGALHQSDLGGPTPKPTGIFLEEGDHPPWLRMGWPRFDTRGRYIGPLPRPDKNIPTFRELPGNPYDNLRKMAAYPEKMCEQMRSG